MLFNSFFSNHQVEPNTEEKLTIKELISRANIVALGLVKYGIIKDDLFFIHGLNSIEYAVTLLAIFFLGNAITTSKPANNVYEVRNQIEKSKASVLFTANSLASIVKKAIDEMKEKQNIKLKFCFDGKVEGFLSYETLLKEGQAIGQKLPKIPYFDIDPKNDIATITYTSGTTGLPKGAMTTHYANIVALEIRSQLESLAKQGVNKQGVGSLHYPLGHASGMIFYQTCLAQGMKIVLIDVPKMDNILSACEKYKVSEIVLYVKMN